MTETRLEIGVYYDGQSSKTAPAHLISLSEARSHKAAGTGHFINHGKAIRLTPHAAPECPDNRLMLAGGSMRDSWSVMNSGGFLVWQMPRNDGMTHDQQAYEHYIIYCANVGITPASAETYLKVTNPLTASPLQMPRQSNNHQPQRERA